MRRSERRRCARKRRSKPRFDFIERFDGIAPVRNALRSMARDIDEWAGIPVPLEGERLVIEPSYPFARAFVEKEETGEVVDDARVRNVFRSTLRQHDVIVYEEKGRVRFGWQRGVGSLDQQMRTLGCSAAWGLEQEARALATLATLIRPHTFKMYFLTGSFLETSPRSKVTYLFRKLRPTIALRAREEAVVFLAALCMHPIGYYDGSWSGAMCPTDDVIASLAMMRADEHMLWRRSNQHGADRPEAGL